MKFFITGEAGRIAQGGRASPIYLTNMPFGINHHLTL